MNIQFQNLHLKNFMSLGDVELGFSNSTILLLGENQDSLGADDNGAGKSSVFEGLRWVLYGETAKSALQALPVEHVLRRGATKAEGRVIFNANGSAVDVTRTRTKTTGKLIVKHKGNQYTGKAAQERLGELMGVDKVQFSNLVHLCGSYPKLFARATDQERKDILAELVEVAVVQQMQDEVKHRLVPIQQEIDEHERKLRDLEVERNLLRETRKEIRDSGKEKATNIKRLSVQAAGRAEALEKAEAGLAKAEAALDKEVAKRADKVEALEIKASDARREANVERDAKLEKASGFPDALSKVTEIHRDQNRQCGELVAKRDRLERLQQGIDETCPECGQELPSVQADHADEIEELNATIEEATTLLVDQQKKIDALKVRQKKMLEKIQKRIDTATAKATKATEERKRLQDMGNLGSLRNAMREAKQERDLVQKEARTLSSNLQVARSSLREAKASYEAKGRRIKEIASELEVIQGYIDAAQDQAADLAFWKEGFSNRGVPSLFIETVLPRISSYIQKYADVLSGGDLQVQLRAFQETKSKTIKEAIQIHAKNLYGAEVYGGNSTGERHRIDLAVTLGLIEYFRDVSAFESNLLVCDEIFDGLDQLGVEKAVEALQASHVTSIWVVSHHQHLASLFGSVWTMKKTEGVSSLEVAA